ncbi:MAG: SRPBCC family protein [Candidatus Nitrosopumilus limneticus]|nr:SRPBCC family protein [Candidatus Nitrosopumilus limneticus]
MAHHSLYQYQLESNIFDTKLVEVKMAIIVVQTEINATVEKVWEVIADIDNEPKFWKGTKEVKTLSKEGNLIKREITITFRDQKCLQEIQLIPKQAIKAKFTKGILDGTKTITLTAKNDIVILQTSWDIKLSGMMEMFTSVIKNHIKSGTEQAMQSIKNEVEK